MISRRVKDKKRKRYTKSKSRNLKNYRKNKQRSKVGGAITDAKISFISYADTKFEQSRQRLLNEANTSGWFTGQIKIYGPQDLSEDFRKKVGEPLTRPRGGGYWLWKPFILYDMLMKLNDNDILLYIDAGCTLNASGLPRFNEYVSMISKDSGYSTLVMQLKSGISINKQYPSLKDRKWTTSAIFEYFKIENNNPIKDLDQVLSGFMLCRKCPESVAVVRKWLDVAETNPKLFTDEFNEEARVKNKNFEDNRHDQSVLDIIVKISPYKETVKIIDEEIETPFKNEWPVHATRIKV